MCVHPLCVNVLRKEVYREICYYVMYYVTV